MAPNPKSSADRDFRAQRREQLRKTALPTAPRPPSPDDEMSGPASDAPPAGPSGNDSDELAQLRQIIDELRQELKTIAAAAPSPAAPPAVVKAEKVRDPDPWDGTKSPDHYLSFKRQVIYKLRRNAANFPTALDKRGYIVSRLSDRPAIAFSNSYDKENAFTRTDTQVWEVLDRLYGLVDVRASAIRKLHALMPSSRANFKEFITEFQLLAQQARWDDLLSQEMLLPKLQGTVRTLAFTMIDEPFATMVNRLLRATETAHPAAPASSSVTTNSPRRSDPTTNRTIPSLSSRRPLVATSGISAAPPRFKRESFSSGPAPGHPKPPSGMKCHNCGSPDHWRDDCPEPIRQYSAASMNQVPEDFPSVGHVEECNARSSFGDGEGEADPDAGKE